MDKSKKLNAIIQVVEAFLFALVPLVISYFNNEIISLVATEAQQNLLVIVVHILGFALAAGILVLINKYIGRWKYFRKYKEFEGTWLEIIPDFSRPISICELKFDDGTYHYNGRNYSFNYKNKVTFTSTVLESKDRDDEFYYVTNSTLVTNPNGFGKVYSMSNAEDGLFKAEGFFFDVVNHKKTTIHKTIMLKYDSAFHKQLKLKPNENPKKFSDRQIIEHSQNFIEEYIKKQEVMAYDNK